MQLLKIIIAILVLITLGIVVGSNLFPMVTVVVLNQPTAVLPIGMWLIISIGLGVLSSSAIQLLLLVQRRSLTKRIRQLQTRIQDRDEDIFTQTDSVPNSADRTTNIGSDKSSRQQHNRSQFSTAAPFVNSQTNSNQAHHNNSISSPATKLGVVDDDWEKAPAFKRQVDWDDLPQQTIQNREDRTYSPPRESRQRAGEIYDADFRLIQPPYRAPAVEFEDEDDLEYLETDGDEDVADENFAPSSSTDASNSEEDWGFDFDPEAADLQSSKPGNRKF